MNRILMHLGDCDCIRKRRRLEAAEAVCDHLNEIAGDVVEAGCRMIDPDDMRLHFWLSAEIEPTGDYECAHLHLAVQLRTVIDDLMGCCERLEGGDA